MISSILTLLLDKRQWTISSLMWVDERWLSIAILLNMNDVLWVTRTNSNWWWTLNTFNCSRDGWKNWFNTFWRGYCSPQITYSDHYITSIPIHWESYTFHFFIFCISSCFVSVWWQIPPKGVQIKKTINFFLPYILSDVEWYVYDKLFEGWAVCSKYGPSNHYNSRQTSRHVIINDHINHYVWV